MREDVKQRAFLPLAIPLGALLVIAIITIGFSRVLLNVPKEVATAVALGVAANILIGAGVVVARRKMSQSQFLLFISTAIVPLAIGGAVATGVLQVGGTTEGHAGEEKVKLHVGAVNVLFEQTELAANTGRAFEIEFENKDQGVAHNVAIFDGPDPSSPNVFRGQVFPGVRTVTYEIPALEEGSYYFHCDVHPATMKGTLSVKPSEDEPVGAREGQEQEKQATTPATATAEVTAKNIAFGPTELEWAAGTPVDLIFHNQDQGIPHNVAIFKGSDARSPNVFRGTTFAGVKTLTYEVPALESGSYYFHCDVHPNMKGTIRVG